MADNIFHYGIKETGYLKRQDPVLGAAIGRIGMIERSVIKDPFAALVSSIIAQQISAKAADSIWNRMLVRFGAMNPDTIAAATPEAIRECGVSLRKAGYIHGIGDAVVEGRLDFSALQSLSDTEIIGQLTALPGIGTWTAEMFLIFCLERPDVVSWNDLAIRRGMMNLYHLSSLDRQEFEKFRQRYSPYGSVASLYLWAVSHE